MNTKHKGKRGFVALKLYVSKAYDRVETWSWVFLERVIFYIGSSQN